MQDASIYAIAGVPPSRGAEWIHLKLGAQTVAQLQATTAPAEVAIEVYANYGRWVVSCPDCSSAQLACKTDLRFLCNECGNVAVGYQWRAVIWPAAIAEIEAALAVRPTDKQNWMSWESVEKLLTENDQKLGDL